MRDPETVKKCNQAIAAAWKRERSLVLNGMGSRNWTAAEQRELIQNGKVKGYHGHHMQSVKAYPEQAGNSDNIQFLTKEEHLYGAHQGKFQNKTNGMYHAEKGKSEEFADGKVKAMKVMRLTEPICKSVDRNSLKQEGTNRKGSEKGKMAIVNRSRQEKIEAFNRQINETVRKHGEMLQRRRDLSPEKKHLLQAEITENAKQEKEKFERMMEQEAQQELQQETEEERVQEPEEETGMEEGSEVETQTEVETTQEAEGENSGEDSGESGGEGMGE